MDTDDAFSTFLYQVNDFSLILQISISNQIDIANSYIDINIIDNFVNRTHL